MTWTTPYFLLNSAESTDRLRQAGDSRGQELDLPVSPQCPHQSDLQRQLQGHSLMSAGRNGPSRGVPFPTERVLGENGTSLLGPGCSVVGTRRIPLPASPLPSQTTTQHPCNATAAGCGEKTRESETGLSTGPAARHCPVCGRPATSRQAARAHGPPHTRLVPSQVSHSPLDASACAQLAPFLSNSSELTDTVRHSQTRKPLAQLRTRAHRAFLANVC